MAAHLRDETPPPRRRNHTEPEDRSVQHHIWSAQPGSGDDWTSSPLPRPKGLDGEKRDCLLPLKVNEDTCFSSPKPGRFGEPAENLFASPQLSSAGKENWQPSQGLRTTPMCTPMKTPSRLPTVQEHDGQGLMPSEAESESARETEPAWVVQSPEQHVEDFGKTMKGLGLSPVPPGFEDVHCLLPKPSVRSTFIQFVSPLKTTSVLSPPKSEPFNFAPAASMATSLFGSGVRDLFEDGSLAMSHSPSPWFEHEQIPFFPASSTAPQHRGAADIEEASGEARQRGPVVRLAEFLPEPDPPATSAAACQPSVDAGYTFSLNGMPMAPMMAGEVAGMAAGCTGMDTSCQQPFAIDSMQMQQQWQMPTLPQLPAEAVQPQLQEPLPQVHAQTQQQPDQGSLQQMQVQLQQMQLQQQMQMQQLQQMQPPLMPTPQMQPQLPQMMQMQPQHMQPHQAQHPQMQAQPQAPIQPPQMQPPQMQPPQMQPPQLPPQMQPDSALLQQMMQMQMQPQMQPPAWPPLQSMSGMIGEQMPAPPPQAAMDAAAPSVLCPNTCHQEQVCRCGEVKVGDCQGPVSSSGGAAEGQSMPSNGTAPNTCILLSAAMFPEMGAGGPMANSSNQCL